MNDETTEVHKKRVRDLFRQWIPLLRMQAWAFTYDWKRASGPERGDSFQTIMKVDADWRYLHAKVTVYLETVEGEDDDHLEEDVIHELTHCHLSEISFDDGDGVHKAHEERVVTCLARAFLEVRNQTRGSIPASTDGTTPSLGVAE